MLLSWTRPGQGPQSIRSMGVARPTLGGALRTGKLPLSKHTGLLMIDPCVQKRTTTVSFSQCLQPETESKLRDFPGCLVVAVHRRAQPTQYQFLWMHVCYFFIPALPQVAMEVTANLYYTVRPSHSSSSLTAALMTHNGLPISHLPSLSASNLIQQFPDSLVPKIQLNMP